MKQQIISGLKKKLLLVELNGSISTNNLPNKSLITWHDEKGFMHTHLFDFNIELIGKLTDITEEQFDKWVMHTQRDDYDLFWDYKTERYWYDTAKESFFSKLEKDEICFENKVVKPNEDDFKLKGRNEQEFRMIEEDRSGKKPTWASIFKRNYRDELNKWQEAQEKVWDINRCWLFEII